MLLGKFLLFSIPFERVIFFEISIFYWIGLIYILSTVIQLNIYKRSILKYAFAYMLIQIISITWSVEIYKTVEHAVKISFFVTLLFALNSKLKNTFNLSDLLKFYLYGYFTSIVFVLMDYYAQGGGGRLQGYNGIDSNSFALMSVFALYSIKRCGIRIKYAFLLNVVAISMVFLTFSRSGVLGLAIYYMYLYFHEEKSVSFKKFFLIIFIFLIVFLMIDYRSSLEYTDLASVTSGRSVFIEMALDLIKNDFNHLIHLHKDNWEEIKENIGKHLTRKQDKKMLKELVLGLNCWNVHNARNIGQIITSILYDKERVILSLDGDMVIPKTFKINSKCFEQPKGILLKGSPDLSRLEWIRLYISLKLKTEEKT